MNKYMYKMIKYANEYFPGQQNVKLLTERIAGIEDNVIYVNRRLDDVFKGINFGMDIAKLFEILVACDLEKDFYFRVIIDQSVATDFGSYNIAVKNVEPYILKLATKIASDIADDKRTFMKLIQIAVEHDEINDIEKFFVSFIDQDIIENIEYKQSIIELLNTYYNHEEDILL